VILPALLRDESAQTPEKQKPGARPGLENAIKNARQLPGRK